MNVPQCYIIRTLPVLFVLQWAVGIVGLIIVLKGEVRHVCQVNGEAVDLKRVCRITNREKLFLTLLIDITAQQELDCLTTLSVVQLVLWLRMIQ